MIYTGLRLSECAGLRKDNFRLMGMNDKSRYVMQVRGKGGRVRTLIVRRDVLKICLGRIAKNRHLVNAPVFLGRDKKSCINSRTLYIKIKRQLNKIGFRDVTPHWFRHSFASNLQRDGLDVNSIRTALGHSDLAMTQRYLDELKFVDISEVG